MRTETKILRKSYHWEGCKGESSNIIERLLNRSDEEQQRKREVTMRSKGKEEYRKGEVRSDEGRSKVKEKKEVMKYLIKWWVQQAYRKPSSTCQSKANQLLLGQEQSLQPWMALDICSRKILHHTIHTDTIHIFMLRTWEIWIGNVA